MLPILASGIFFGVLSALIAHHKGREEVIWFLLGFFFHLFALVVFFLPPVCKPGVLKKCPECAEIIRSEAKLCRYCGSSLLRSDMAEVG